MASFSGRGDASPPPGSARGVHFSAGGGRYYAPVQRPATAGGAGGGGGGPRHPPAPPPGGETITQRSGTVRRMLHHAASLMNSAPLARPASPTRGASRGQTPWYTPAAPPRDGPLLPAGHAPSPSRLSMATPSRAAPGDPAGILDAAGGHQLRSTAAVMYGDASLGPVNIEPEPPLANAPRPGSARAHLSQPPMRRLYPEPAALDVDADDMDAAVARIMRAASKPSTPR
jgi:hypothetical protein